MDISRVLGRQEYQQQRAGGWSTGPPHRGESAHALSHGHWAVSKGGHMVRHQPGCVGAGRACQDVAEGVI